MAHLRGIPLDSDRATFEAYEQRVEDRLLNEYLSQQEDAEAAEEARQARWDDA